MVTHLFKNYIPFQRYCFVRHNSVRFLVIVAQVLKLDTKAIDFVIAFPQADIYVPVYMELPAGMDLAGNGKIVQNTY